MEKVGILTPLGRLWTRFRAVLAGMSAAVGPGPAWALPGGGRIVVASIGNPSEAAEAGPSFRPIPGGGVGPEAGAGAGSPGREAEPPTIDQLYRKYSPALYWVCMKYVRNKEDAEDMVNQVFVKVQQHLPGFLGQSQVYTWMYRIAVNECIQMFRRRKFEVDPGSLPDSEAALSFHPEKAMDARVMLGKLLAKADAETSEILFLLYLEGLTQEEVVERLGISRSTVNRKVTDFKSRVEKYR